MIIKQIVIEGDEDDVTICRTERGAVVSANDVEIEVERYADREERFGVAYNASRVVYGTDRRGGPNATNSMIHDVLREIERLAGC